MTETTKWGCPTGLFAPDYGDASSWSLDRWRWEFKRRSKHIRLEYEFRLMRQYRQQQGTDFAPRDLMWREDYKNEYFHLFPGDVARLGIPYLCNPLYSKRPSEGSGVSFELLKKRTVDASHFGATKDQDLDAWSVLGVGGIAVAFDPDRPIGPQIEGLEGYLMSLRHPQTPEDPKRVRIDKWLVYLRLLDARAIRVSWADCADAILPATNARTAQSARDGFKQARRLQASM